MSVTDNGGYGFSKGMDEIHIRKTINEIAIKDGQISELTEQLELMTQAARIFEQQFIGAYNKAIDDVVAFIKDWYESERYLDEEGNERDFYEELLKLKK